MATSMQDHKLRSLFLHDIVCSFEIVITSIYFSLLPHSFIYPTTSLRPFPLPSLHQITQHNYQLCLPLGLSPIDPLHASSFPLSIHPSIRPSVHLFIHPFISMSMWEVKWTHLMGLCVSSKWLAQVSHWQYRWATHCSPRLPWCQRKCHISWEEL